MHRRDLSPRTSELRPKCHAWRNVPTVSAIVQRRCHRDTSIHGRYGTVSPEMVCPVSGTRGRLAVLL
jgi:hypothetical protein